MEHASGGVIGFGTTLCAIGANLIRVDDIIQATILAAIGAIVGFVVTFILKSIERKLTKKS